MESQHHWEAVSHIYRIEELCGRILYRRDGKPFRYYCGSRLCPDCMEWKTWLATPVKERAAALCDRLVAGLDDPETHDWLYVTIDMVEAELVVGPLADYARCFKEAMKKALDRAGAREMDVRCLMFCHVSTRAGSDDGKLHWHGWIGAPGLTEVMVRSWLPYQSKGNLITRVEFEYPRESQELMTALQYGLRYAIRVENTFESRQAVTETLLGIRGGVRGGGDRFEYGLRGKGKVNEEEVDQSSTDKVPSSGDDGACPSTWVDDKEVTASPANDIMTPVSPCRRDPPSVASG